MFDFLILWVYCVFEKIFKWFHVFLNKLATFQLVLVSSEFLGMLPEVFFFFLNCFKFFLKNFLFPTLQWQTVWASVLVPRSLVWIVNHHQASASLTKKKKTLLWKFKMKRKCLKNTCLVLSVQSYHFFRVKTLVFFGSKEVEEGRLIEDHF